MPISGSLSRDLIQPIGPTGTFRAQKKFPVDAFERDFPICLQEALPRPAGLRRPHPRPPSRRRASIPPTVWGRLEPPR